MAIRIKDLQLWTQARIIGVCEESASIQQWHYDSRKIFNGEAGIFIALKSKRHNGHDYLQDAYARGIRLFLCSETQPLPSDACMLMVSDVLKALQEAAAAYRKQFEIPLIGITGSNGKTIVKEWLFQLLCHEMNIVRSPRSFNSQLGLPLSIFALNPKAELGIFEAGISQRGEMPQLEQVLQPEIGVFTNLGDAHDAGFKDRTEKLDEKLMLFRRSKSIIYCRDQTEVHAALTEKYGLTHQLFNWSETDERADVFIRSLEKIDQGKAQVMEIMFKENLFRLTLPFSDRASFENAITAFSVVAFIGRLTDKILSTISALEPIEMRLQQKEGIKQSKLLLDFYNSDQLGLEHALDQLVNMHPDREKLVILSDFEQQQPDQELYHTILQKLKDRDITCCIGIGDHWSKVTDINGIDFHAYSNTQSFLDNIRSSIFESRAILIKGSRSYEFEKLAGRLQQHMHNSRLEVDLSAMRHNLNIYRKHLRPGQRMMVMVKALAYGSGSHRVARMLQYEGVDYLAVAYTDEGVSLREEGITLPIMVMSPSVDDFRTMLTYELEPDIYSLEMLRRFGLAIRQAANTHAGVHLEFDTGMHRLGFSKEELPEVIDHLNDFPELKVKSVFSHFASSDEAESDFSLRQLNIFKEIRKVLINTTGLSSLFHMANSAGILAYNRDSDLNMVRLGIGLYGYDPRAEIQDQLETAIRLKSYVVQLRTVKAGEGVGYGQNNAVTHDRKIAVVALGYADGYFRQYSKAGAWVSIRSQKAYLTGNICMDMFMCDVTSIIGVQVNDEVEIWGENPGLIQMAEWANTIPYEVLTAVSERVQRVYLQE